MGQIRHGSATITHAVRAAIQRSQASLSDLSRELGINPKTVAKWRKRSSVEDRKTGPKEPRLTVLTEGEEAIVVAFRRHTVLPLDDCLYTLQRWSGNLDQFAAQLSSSMGFMSGGGFQVLIGGIIGLGWRQQPV